MLLMGVICWMILGMLAGFVASRVVNEHSQGLALDLVFGIIGALIGGGLINAVGTGFRGFNFWSLLGAGGGAAVSLLVRHAVRGRVSRT